MPLVADDHRDTSDLSSRPGAWLPFTSTRISVARYDPGLSQIHVVFPDGVPWVYDQVPRNIWRNFRRAASAGRYVNRVLNGYPYFRGSFSYAGHLDETDSEPEVTTPNQRASERRERSTLSSQLSDWDRASQWRRSLEARRT